jgi:extradiol dioxygenase
VKIVALGYIGFQSPKAKEWETFGPEIFGFGLAEPGEDGTVYLRMDDHHHRIAISPGYEDALSYIGWQLPDKKAYIDAIAELDRKEYPYELSTRVVSSRQTVPRLCCRERRHRAHCHGGAELDRRDGSFRQ